ncbi:MAG: hypothetical protein WCW35_00510 [Bacteroidota bacterium]
MGMLIVRAAIIAIILNLMVGMHEALYKNTERIFLSETISAPAQVIAADLKLAGYNSTNKQFPVAQINEMSFYADIDTNGTVDVIRFYQNITTSRLKKLYRSINGGSVLEIARNVTTFKVLYFTNTGSTTSGTPCSNIKSVYIKMVIESRNRERIQNSGTSDNTVRSVKWEEHIFPENL